MFSPLIFFTNKIFCFFNDLIGVYTYSKLSKINFFQIYKNYNSYKFEVNSAVKLINKTLNIKLNIDFGFFTLDEDSILSKHFSSNSSTINFPFYIPFGTNSTIDDTTLSLISINRNDSDLFSLYHELGHVVFSTIFNDITLQSNYFCLLDNVLEIKKTDSLQAKILYRNIPEESFADKFSLLFLDYLKNDISLNSLKSSFNTLIKNFSN